MCSHYQQGKEREAFKRNQRCIIAAAALYEPDWRSGKAVASRIEHVHGGGYNI
jgi:hypothetical protein